MELNEAVRRIFGRHVLIIFVFVVIGVTIGAAMHLGDPKMYEAATRFVMGTDDPTTQEASQAIADAARGIASGPSTIQKALNDLGVSRDPYDLAQHHLAVEALGSSGVLTLTVTDPDPRVAVGLADELAGLVISTRNSINDSRPAEFIDRFDQQIASITSRILDVSTHIDQLDRAIASASSPDEVRDLQAARGRLVTIQTSLSNEQAALQSEYANITTQDALRPQASIVDKASLAPHTVPSGVVPDLVLGGLLGLLVGVFVSAGLEMVRPNVVGRVALEREMGAPVLGEIPGRLGAVDRLDRSTVVTHLDMAAASNKVHRVELIGAERGADLARLAELLGADGSVGNGARVAVSVAGSTDARHVNGWASNNHRRAGFVLVTPTVVPRSDLQPVSDVLTVSRFPLIGIITYEWGGELRRLRPVRERGPKSSGPTVGVGEER